MRTLPHISRNKIVAFVILGLAIGLAINSIPATVSASSTVVITRGIDAKNSDQYFAYEGFYAAQTANSYTDTLVALVESTDVRKQALERLGIGTDSISLHRYSRKITARKSAPQALEILTKGPTEKEAVELWGSVYEAFSLNVYKIQANGDNQLGITAISEEPIIRYSYRNTLVFGLAGAVISVSLYIGYELVRNFLIEEHL